MDNTAVHEIATHGLRKVFRSYFAPHGRQVVAVDGLDLAISAGEIYGFLGPNGAGKTTTIKMILGLVRPTAGGVDMPRGIRAPDGRMRVGAVLEGSRNVYMRMSVMENLWYFGLLRGMKSADFRPRAKSLLELFELSGKANATAQTLSRGMQQKLAFAVALIHDPDILLLDEPTLGLDVATARAIQVRLLELAHREGKAVLLTTHQMELAEAVSDRVGIINNGKMVAEDTVAGLTGLFKRQEYEFEVDFKFREQALRALDRFECKEKDSRRPGKTGFLVQLSEKEDLFRLVHALEGQGVVPEGLTEIAIRLEDVFISFTSKDDLARPAGKGGGA